MTSKVDAPERVPSLHYRPISHRHLDASKARPFHRSVYADGEGVRGVAQVGFPSSTRGEKIHPWVPGVSTPEGIILVTGVAAALHGGDGLVRAVQSVATGLVMGATSGIPAAAMWFSATFQR